jgi:hypothetical protein
MGGARYGTGGRYYRKLKKKKAIGGYAYANYGPNNDDIIGAMNVGYTYNPFNQGKISFNVGSSFDFIFNGDAIVNMISRSNIYKKNNFSINHKMHPILEIAIGVALGMTVFVVISWVIGMCVYVACSKNDCIFFIAVLKFERCICFNKSTYQ